MTVSISDGHSRLELVRVGDPETGYPVSSYRTRMAVTSGPFSVTVEAFAQNYAYFLQALSQLHESMAGEVKLQFWNQEHLIVLKGAGDGGIQLAAKVTDGRSPWAA